LRAARGVPRPIVFVPVNIGYEKLVEASSYLDEGARRKRRDPRDVVRGVRLVKRVFGRVPSFGAPFDSTNSSHARPPGIAGRT
jgi:glycerol-3-phosphate O-acyltransferase